MQAIEAKHPVTGKKVQIRWNDGPGPSPDHINELLGAAPAAASSTATPPRLPAGTGPGTPSRFAIPDSQAITATAPRPTDKDRQDFINSMTADDVKRLGLPQTSLEVDPDVAAHIRNLQNVGGEQLPTPGNPQPPGILSPVRAVVKNIADMPETVVAGAEQAAKGGLQIAANYYPVLQEMNPEIVPGKPVEGLANLGAGIAKAAGSAAMGLTLPGWAFGAANGAAEMHPDVQKFVQGLMSPADMINLGHSLGIKDEELAGNVNQIANTIWQVLGMKAVHGIVGELPGLPRESTLSRNAYGEVPSYREQMSNWIKQQAQGAGEPEGSMMSKVAPNGLKIVKAAVKYGKDAMSGNSHPEIRDAAVAGGMHEGLAYNLQHGTDGWLDEKGNFWPRSEIQGVSETVVPGQRPAEPTAKRTTYPNDSGMAVNVGLPAEALNAKIKKMSRGEEIPFYYDDKKEEAVSGEPGDTHLSAFGKNSGSLLGSGRYDEGGNIVAFWGEPSEHNQQHVSNVLFDLVKNKKIKPNATVYFAGDGTNMSVKDAIAGGSGNLEASVGLPFNSADKARRAYQKIKESIPFNSNDRERQYDRQFEGTAGPESNAREENLQLEAYQNQFFDKYGQTTVLRGSDVSQWHPAEQRDLANDLEALNMVRSRAGLKPIQGPQAFVDAAARYNSNRPMDELGNSYEDERAKMKYRIEAQQPMAYGINENANLKNEAALHEDRAQALRGAYRRAQDAEMEKAQAEREAEAAEFRKGLLKKKGALQEGGDLESGEYINPDALWNGGSGHPVIYDMGSGKMYHGGWAETHGEMSRRISGEAAKAGEPAPFVGNPREQEDRYIMSRSTSAKNADTMAIWNSLGDLDPNVLSDFLFKQVKSGHIDKDTRIVFGESPNHFYTLKDALSGNLKVSLGIPGMKGKDILDMIKSIKTSTAANGGSTHDPRTGQPITTGTSVSIFPNRSQIVDKLTNQTISDYIEKNSDLLRDEGHNLGTWFDKSTGKTYLDVVATLPKEEDAVALGKQYNQKAVFSHDKLDEIPTGGTGESIDESQLPPENTRLRSFTESKLSPEERTALDEQRKARVSKSAYRQFFGEQENQIETAKRYTEYQKNQLGMKDMPDIEDTQAQVERLKESLGPDFERVHKAWDEYATRTGIQPKEWYKGWETAKPILAKYYPELKDPVKSKLFGYAMNVFANGGSPNDEFMNGIGAWERYRDTGKFSALKARDEYIGNTRENTWSAHLTELQNLIKMKGEAGAVKWLETKHPVDELNTVKGKIRASNAPELPSDYVPNIPAEYGKGQPQEGAYIFGPKMGAYALNKEGISGPITLDKWMNVAMRMARGIVKTVTKKNPVTGEPFEQLAGANTVNERRVAYAAIQDLAKQYGTTPENVQAMLWQHVIRPFFEKHGQQMKGGFGDHGDFARWLDESGWLKRRVAERKGASLTEGSQITRERGLSEGATVGPESLRNEIRGGDANETGEGDTSFDPDELK